MEKKYSFLFLIALIPLGLTMLQQSDSSIPPTPAYSKLQITNNTGTFLLNATSYNEVLKVISNEGLRLSFENDSLKIIPTPQVCSGSDAMQGYDINGNIICVSVGP